MSRSFGFYKKLLSISCVLLLTTIIFVIVDHKFRILKKNRLKNHQVQHVNSAEDNSRQSSEKEKIIHENDNDSKKIPEKETNIAQDEDFIAVKNLMKKFCSYDKENADFSNQSKTNIVCNVTIIDDSVEKFSFKRINEKKLINHDNIIIYSKSDFINFAEEVTNKIKEFKQKINSKKPVVKEEEKIDNAHENLDSINEKIDEQNKKSIEANQEEDVKETSKNLETIILLFEKSIIFLRDIESKILEKF